MSGEAYAVFFLKGTELSGTELLVYLQVSPDVVDRSGILWRRVEKGRELGGNFGPGMQNRWANKNTTAEDLARKIHKTFVLD